MLPPAPPKPDGSRPTRTTPFRWSAERDDYLRRHYRPGNGRELAEAMDTTYHAVIQRAARLGLGFKRIRWTPQQDDTIRRLYGVLENDDLAEMFGHGRHGEVVMRRARRLGLPKGQGNRQRALMDALSEARDLRILLAWRSHLLPGEQACTALGVTPEALVRRATVEALKATKGLGG